jgi:hypothetical protein
MNIILSRRARLGQEWVTARASSSRLNHADQWMRERAHLFARTCWRVSEAGSDEGISALGNLLNFQHVLLEECFVQHWHSLVLRMHATNQTLASAICELPRAAFSYKTCPQSHARVDKPMLARRARPSLRLATPAGGRIQRRLSLGFHNWLFRDAKCLAIQPSLHSEFVSGSMPACVERCVDIELTLQASSIDCPCEDC